MSLQLVCWAHGEKVYNPDSPDEVDDDDADADALPEGFDFLESMKKKKGGK